LLSQAPEKTAGLKALSKTVKTASSSLKKTLSQQPFQAGFHAGYMKAKAEAPAASPAPMKKSGPSPPVPKGVIQPKQACSTANGGSCASWCCDDNGSNSTKFPCQCSGWAIPEKQKNGKPVPSKWIGLGKTCDNWSASKIKGKKAFNKRFVTKWCNVDSSCTGLTIKHWKCDKDKEPWLWDDKAKKCKKFMIGCKPQPPREGLLRSPAHFKYCKSEGGLWDCARCCPVDPKTGKPKQHPCPKAGNPWLNFKTGKPLMCTCGARGAMPCHEVPDKKGAPGKSKDCPTGFASGKFFAPWIGDNINSDWSRCQGVSIGPGVRDGFAYAPERFQIGGVFTMVPDTHYMPYNPQDLYKKLKKYDKKNNKKERCHVQKRSDVQLAQGMVLWPTSRRFEG
jgi:hypothetical protein